MTIGILCISTRKYHIYVQQLLDGVKKHFLLNHEIEFHLFTDVLEREYVGDDRVKVIKELIPSEGFPLITLHRYHHFVTKTYDCDYLFYLDIDMSIVDTVDDSILGDIVVVKHPGFSEMGGGSWGNNKLSTSYTYPENRTVYVAGGVNGGRTEYFYRLMQRMKRDIDEDERNGVMPEWQDETVLNCHISEMKSFKLLDSSFCMVEEISLREKWKLTHLTPRIIALSKDHNAMRN